MDRIALEWREGLAKREFFRSLTWNKEARQERRLKDLKANEYYGSRHGRAILEKFFGLWAKVHFDYQDRKNMIRERLLKIERIILKAKAAVFFKKVDAWWTHVTELGENFLRMRLLKRGFRQFLKNQKYQVLKRDIQQHYEHRLKSKAYDALRSYLDVRRKKDDVMRVARVVYRKKTLGCFLRIWRKR